MKRVLCGFLWGVIGIGLGGNAVSGPTPCVQREDVRVFFESGSAISDDLDMRVLFQSFVMRGWMDVQMKRNQGQSIPPPNIRCIFRIIASSRDNSRTFPVSCTEVGSLLHGDRGYVRRIGRVFSLVDPGCIACDFEVFLREHRGDFEESEQ